MWLRGTLSDADLAPFDKAADLPSKPGQRLDIDLHLSDALAPGGAFITAIESIDPKARPVRAVAFNKSEDSNWGVSWHQDRVIAVADRHQMGGFVNWTRKSGIWHCEPPRHTLSDMLFVRVHLDDADDENGAMRIALGSHRQGLIPSIQAEETAARCEIDTGEARRGDVLILKMLILHGSKPSKNLAPRRALRVDFASIDLPEPLRWSGVSLGSVGLFQGPA